MLQTSSSSIRTRVTYTNTYLSLPFKTHIISYGVSSVEIAQIGPIVLHVRVVSESSSNERYVIGHADRIIVPRNISNICAVIIFSTTIHQSV